jgi:MarR family transcriptional regulator, negative regulator of the multidrug operon emrRAB
MHTENEEPANPRGAAPRTANLLGALALEAALVQEQAAQAVVGQAGAAAGALDTVAAYPGRTTEALRKPLGLSQPGAARLVERLAEAGWVERAGPGGRRGLELRPTPEGAEVLDELLAARRAALTELLAPLSEDEQRQLTTLLEKLLAARTTDRIALERLCRLCERRVCRRCPVSGALANRA